MSLIRTTPGFFENFTFIARPTRDFVSSSQGVTGSVKVLPQASSIGRSLDIDEDGAYDDGDLGSALATLVAGTSLGAAETYLSAVNDSPPPALASRMVGINRLEPSAGFISGSMGKGIIRSNLYPYYKTAYPSSHWGYRNYLSLNFISGSGFSTGSALMYANPTTAGQPKLTPSGAFTFEFYVKPTMRVSGTYHAGTVLHVSSSFAISLVSGSALSPDGKPDSFRVLLQLSHSAETPPSQVDLSLSNNGRTFPDDLNFLSEDSITFNGWHHVAVRWGGSGTDFGSGSFFIDGNQAGAFYIPSESVTRTTYTEDSRALFVGNFYEGPNASGNGVKELFVTGTEEGFTDPYGATGVFPSRPMSHQLAGELHEIRIWQTFRSLDLIRSGASSGIPTPDETLKFYLGPFFGHESLQRSVLISPYASFVTATNAPFDAEMAFSLGGHLINAENHLRDYVSGYFPRLLNLTASQTFSSIPTAFPNITGTNGYLFVTESAVRKNLLILPCDNGKFTPNFALLQTASFSPFFADSPGTVKLEGLIRSGVSSSFYSSCLDGKISSLGGPTWPSGSVSPCILFPAGLVRRPGGDITNTDDSSNLVSIFNISNLLYGSKIHPSSFSITDPSFTGSQGLLSFKLQDNGMGGLYRADCTTPHAKWNTVGTLLYEEGIACITSPYLGDLFGKDSYEVSFRGEQPVPLLTANVQVPAWKINSSSSPSYLPLTASDYANESGDPIVYITRVNFHDSDLNVVGRAELAQPVAKRLSDKFLIKVKFDF
jgi:hypothetical protein